MIVEDLKKSILKAAFEGKLSTQIEKEHIELEKVKLNKDYKKIKEIDIKDKLVIPNNWIQRRFGEVVIVTSGQDLTRERYFEKEIENSIPYLTGASNIDENGNIIINRFTNTPTSIAKKGDLLLTCKGTIGQMAFLKEEQAHIARQFMALDTPKLNPMYVYYFLKSSVNNLISNAKSMIPGIDRDYIMNLVIPIPPKEEQNRIVEKISMLFEKLDEIKPLEEELQLLKNDFPTKMKKSVLGNYFSNNDNSEKLEKCIKNIPSKSFQIKQSEIKETGKFPVVSQSQKIIEGYSNEFDKLLIHEKPYIVYGDHTNNVKLIDFNFVVGADGTKIFEINSNYNEKYLYYNLLYNSLFVPNNSYSRHYKYLKELPIIKREIEEQLEVVNQIETIFPLCNDIDELLKDD